MDPIKEALTFDDVTLAPQYSKVLPSEVSTRTILSNQLKLDIPILSSAMDTVTESKMAIALAKQGGIGVIHRNLTISQQINEIKKVKSKSFKVGAAVGTNESELNRIKNILKLNIDLIVVDTAHGHSQKVADTILKIRKIKPKKTTLCAGNIATAEGARFLCKLGVDVIKVGIGPGSVCTTRIKTGIGYPQLSAVIECADAAHGLNAHIIADGGCTSSGDIVKAFAGGADFVMIGGMLAGHDECDGEVEDGVMKFYGMASESAMSRHNIPHREYRGVEGKTVEVDYRGPVKETIIDILSGIRSACTYLGAEKLKSLSKCATFVRVNNTHNKVYE